MGEEDPGLNMFAEERLDELVIVVSSPTSNCTPRTMDYESFFG